MKSCVLRFFCGEITKCSVFRPRFRKLLRLALSTMFSYVESEFYHVSNDFMDFSLDYPLIPSVDFFKTTSSCYFISKVRHIRI